MMDGGLQVSDELLGTFAPIVLYWLYSGIYMMLGSMESYRLHSRKDEDEKNLVPKKDVVIGVLLQQAVQAVVATILFAVDQLRMVEWPSYWIEMEELQISLITVLHLSASTILVVTGSDSESAQAEQISFVVLGRQFFVAMMTLDTWQYFMHRYMHHNKFLYRHVHSQHHRLVVPYAFGALYNHPLEGVLLDTVGGALAFLVSGMSPRASIFFFSFATMKTVDDHCGLWLPGNPFHLFFKNNSAYHDIHHQLYGTKYNYSQPFL
ncbi:UNVERIFIED_CONTAM: Sphinganine C4-monooxygenase 1 [Sesamum calycinum]|uniref:Sphinganine C4-monooxygenase 1 n=1 Tax=Sesamum calycinum TaxID=2727403 RepID=A0AAW2PPD3_9LAMI